MPENTTRYIVKFMDEFGDGENIFDSVKLLVEFLVFAINKKCKLYVKEVISVTSTEEKIYV